MKRVMERVKRLHRGRVAWMLTLFLATAMFAVVNAPAVIGTAATARQLPIYCVQRDQKLVSISFDAAWGNEDTQQLIDILAKYQVTATFFVVGNWVDKYPESVKVLHDAGHEVMNHSNTHAHYPQLSAGEVVADLNACNDKIEAVTGVRPTLVRLPYGDYDDMSINAVRSIGMEPIQWDVDVSRTGARALEARRCSENQLRLPIIGIYCIKMESPVEKGQETPLFCVVKWGEIAFYGFQFQSFCAIVMLYGCIFCA